MSSPPNHQNQPQPTPQQNLIIQESIPNPTDPHLPADEPQIKTLEEPENEKVKDEEGQQNTILEVQKVIATNLFKKFEDEQTISKCVMRKPLMNFTSARKIAKRQKIGKGSSQSMQDKLDQIELINEQCSYIYDKYDRKLNRKTSTKQPNQINANVVWFYNEFFYSNYDRKYFEKKNMHILYEQLQLTPGKTKFKDHKNILKALPRPKLFNDEFLAMQKLKLEQFRNSCRQTTKNLSKSNESTTDFPVNSIVLALHPLCGHLHTGSIMAYYKQSLYMVRFLKPQLPAQKILDINMSTQFTNLCNKTLKNELVLDRNISLGQNNSGEIIEQVNFQTMASFIKILTFKNDVIRMMKAINERNQIQQNFAPQENTQMNKSQDKQIFRWLAELVQQLDKVVKEVLVRFRLRGVNEQNSNLIFPNIRNLLLNPLKLMSKQFENSHEQSDINAAEQIRQIIYKQRESLISRALKSAMAVSKQENKENRTTLPDQMNDLIRSCLGVLVDLKVQGKSFDVYSNSNLIRLGELSGEKNSQAFNEVYQRLFSIVAKVKE